MSQTLHSRAEIISKHWNGPYTLVCRVRANGKIESVSVVGSPLAASDEVYFEDPSAFTEEEKNEIGGLLLSCYYGIDEDVS